MFIDLVLYHLVVYNGDTYEQCVIQLSDFYPGRWPYYRLTNLRPLNLT
jgi:hypothetical protein